MNNDYTHVCLILDASGSMQQSKQDIIGIVDNFITTQKALPGICKLDVFKFTHKVDHIINNEDMSSVKDVMTKYTCTGMTAMNDAIGSAINTLGTRFSSMDEADRPAHVLIAIITDGYENSSREFSQAAVRALIEEQQTKYAWHFEYLAANQDAVLNGACIGISAFNCGTFDQSAKGFCATAFALNSKTAILRCNGEFNKSTAQLLDDANNNQ